MKRIDLSDNYKKAVKTNRKRLRHYFLSKKEQKQLDNNVFGWNNAIFNVDVNTLIMSIGYFSYCSSCLGLSLNTCRLLFFYATRGLDRLTTITDYVSAVGISDSPNNAVTYCRQTTFLRSKGLIEKKSKTQCVITPYALYLLEQFKKDFEGLSALRG